MKKVDWNKRELIPEERRKKYFKAYFDNLPPQVICDVSYVVNKHLDVPYANISDSEKLDIYLPESHKGAFPGARVYTRRRISRRQ